MSHIYRIHQPPPTQQWRKISAEILSGRTALRRFQTFIVQVSVGTLGSFCVVLSLDVCFVPEGNLKIGPSNQTVPAAENRSVVLPCQTVPKIDVRQFVVEWNRGDRKVHYYKSQGDDPTNPGRRTSLFHDEMSKGNISLRLTDVTSDDNGSYTCSVHCSSGGHVIAEGVVTLSVGESCCFRVHLSDRRAELLRLEHDRYLGILNNSMLLISQQGIQQSMEGVRTVPVSEHLHLIYVLSLQLPLTVFRELSLFNSDVEMQKEMKDLFGCMTGSCRLSQVIAGYCNFWALGFNLMNLYWLQEAVK